MKFEKKDFGKTTDGQQVHLCTIENNNGMSAKVSTYGAILVSLIVPDKNGDCADVVMGYDSAEEYIGDIATYFGSTVGRYAGHILGSKFTLDGKEYKLAANDGVNHIHGGVVGFNKGLWTAREVQAEDAIGVELNYLSKDGEEGYPGNLNVTVTYWLTDENELKIFYQGASDKATPVSLTNHTYFNLAGHGSGDILLHELMIDADSFNPVDDTLAPVSPVESLTDTPLDFRQSTSIGLRIAKVATGYDHNYALNNTDGSVRLVSKLIDPKSGRAMEVHSTEPALQLYSGNFLDGTIKAKGGAVYNKHGAVCLETQQFPDAPNNPNYPSSIIQAGEKYIQKTIFKFTNI